MKQQSTHKTITKSVVSVTFQASHRSMVLSRLPDYLVSASTMVATTFQESIHFSKNYVVYIFKGRACVPIP